MMRIKSNVVFLLPALVVTGLSSAQPAIKCFQPTYDFGERYSDEIVVHEFVIENAGTEALVLHEPHAHCGCTTVELDRDSIAPGGRATLTTIVDLHGKAGAQKVSIEVKSNDPKTPKLELALTGSVLPLIYVDPPQIDFGTVARGKDVSHGIRIVTVRDGLELKVKDIHVPKTLPLIAEAVPEEDGSVAVNVQLVKGATDVRGYFGGVAKIHIEQPREHFIDLPVSGEILHEVRVHPPALQISERRRSGKGPNHPLFVRILPGTTEEFELLGIELPTDSIVSEVHSDGSGGYIVGLSDLPPPAVLEGKSITFLTDIESSERVSVRIEAINTGL